MRTVLYQHDQPPLFPLPISSPSPSPSPSTSAALQFPDLFASIPVAKSAFDLVTIGFIAGLLLLSLLSLSFIIYLRFKSRRLQHLENFNSLWTVRLLLVLLSTFWAINEILRLPLVRRKYLYPLLPSITLQQQADICKIHAILSLGLFEPSFLVTLLFLVNVSIKKENPSRIWALASLFMVCAPMTVLQILFVYFQPFEGKMPRFMHGSSVPGKDVFGNRTMLCTYPFFSCVIFGGFAVIYSMVFLLSCWRMMEMVINKGMRKKINSLATVVMVALSVQIVCLSLSWLWMPDEMAYGFVVLVLFLFVMGSMVMGEVILVIKPIVDALAVGGEVRLRTVAVQEAEERPRQ
ncbi:hypothetical protein CASFOL_004271 [Castilleja foliolosa]|uniref:Uncharacterized protein n=1 Tax=Castilleja foliolosa TaxID=1961234 RepID=A0ABD3EAQ8_9LAMI